MNGNGINGYGAGYQGPISNGYLGNGGGNAGGAWDGGKPSKPKHMNPNRTSMNEMKRRVAGIMEFVSRTQSELEGREAATPPGSGGSASSVGMRDANGNGVSGLGILSGGSSEKESKEVVQSMINGIGGGDGAPSQSQSHSEPIDEHAHAPVMDDKSFASLSSAEMIHVLKGRLLSWQREFGVWGEK